MPKYKLATSTHFCYDRSCKIPVTHEIERLAFCGFKNLDFNFLDMCMNKNSDFLSDNYKEWICNCKRVADYCGVKFVQAHAPCETIWDTNNYDLLVNLCIRAMECCSVLGIPWMVYHPLNAPKDRFGSDLSCFDFNMKFFKELLPYAEKYSVGIAIENIIPFYGGTDLTKMIDEQINLVDSLNSELVGICLDVGHLNLLHTINGTDNFRKQSDIIKMFGKRLKCTHIHDNMARNFPDIIKANPQSGFYDYGNKFDEHLSPYMGSIDWDDVIAGLDAIDYEHYFTYECHNAAAKLPSHLVNNALIQLREIGEFMISKSTK